MKASLNLCTVLLLVGVAGGYAMGSHDFTPPDAQATITSLTADLKVQKEQVASLTALLATYRSRVGYLCISLKSVPPGMNKLDVSPRGIFAVCTQALEETREPRAKTIDVLEVDPEGKLIGIYVPGMQAVMIGIPPGK